MTKDEMIYVDYTKWQNATYTVHRKPATSKHQNLEQRPQWFIGISGMNHNI